MKVHLFLTILLASTLFACSPSQGDPAENPEAEAIKGPAPEEDKAVSIIKAAIAQHGGELYEGSLVEFDFRGRHYTSRREGGQFTYERIFSEENGDNVRDVLTNEGLTREVNNKQVKLSSKDSSAYSNSVNSVLYFVLLPYFLEDPAVYTSYLGETTIKGEPYHEIMVTFSEQGGGKDHDDEFVYWFHQSKNTLDYLAYNYLTDGGGARFREAHNIRTINGIRFADYINYKPPGDARDVQNFDQFFEEGKLTEVSRIDSENIKVDNLQ